MNTNPSNIVLPDANGCFPTPADGAKFLAVSYGMPQVPLRGKNPAIGGKGWQDKGTTDPAAIDALAIQHPGCNFGSVSKREIGGFFAIETDSPEVKKRFAADTGLTTFGANLIIMSGEGRAHWWFEHDAASITLANIAQEDAEGFSLRLNNEQCTSVGSIHPVRMTQYSIILAGMPGPASPQLIEWLRAQKEKTKKRQKNSEVKRDRNGLIPQGAIHDCLVNEVSRLCSSGYGLEDREEALLMWARSNCAGPLDEKKVRQVAQSTAEWEMGNPAAKLILMGDRVLGSHTPPTAGPTPSPKTGRRLSLVKASSIKIKHISWLWDNKILANKPNVLFGEPGLGKGFIGTDFVARMTTGADFYDGPNNNEPCSAMMACDEDDWAETIKPRLMVAGADIDRVYSLKVEHGEANSVEEGLLALDEDLPRMAKLLEENPDIRIILIDPLATYVGKLDSNKDKEMRPIYTAMAKFAEKYKVCFVLIAHPNKNEEANAINRLSGAKALTSVFRNTWLVEKDPEDKSARIMASVKGNLASEGDKKGLRFHVVNVEDTGLVAEDGETIKNIGRLVWTGETDKDADELLQDARGGGAKFKEKQEEINTLELLRDFLKDGARPAVEFYDQAALLNLSERATRKAKARLKLKNRKIGGTYYWARTEEHLDAKRDEVDRARCTVLIGGKTVGE